MIRVARPVGFGPNSAIVFASRSAGPCSKSGGPALGESVTARSEQPRQQSNHGVDTR